jgi:hypothetical protein
LAEELVRGVSGGVKARERREEREVQHKKR